MRENTPFPRMWAARMGRLGAVGFVDVQNDDTLHAA
jgi:hypothetical protein